MPLNRP